jgi:hypothetical protein
MNKLQNSELKILAEEIRDNVFVPSVGRKRTVFLCGADLNDRTTGRHKMAKLLKSKKNYEVLYPEDIFEDLMYGQGQYSLLELENVLASSVDAIILLPESPGSFAELGAFASNEKLVCKIVCIGEKKYKKRKSFINYGPLRIIKSNATGKLINISYDDIESDYKKEKVYRRINASITKIRNESPVYRNVANIMETENFVLPCVYLMGFVSSSELCKLVHYATGESEEISDIATKSSISRLIKNNYIRRTQSEYQTTSKGMDRVRSLVKSVNLDRVRTEIINSQQRNKTMVKSANFESAHP